MLGLGRSERYVEVPNAQYYGEMLSVILALLSLYVFLRFQI